MGSVSVIVVSYNTRELLRECLRYIPTDHETIVVDNASLDGSASMVETEFPHVLLIKNDRNVGFGPANNQGLELATRSLVLLLNSDAIAGDGSVERLARVFDDASIVAAGGRLLFPDGSVQESCARELTLWRVACEQLWLEKAFPKSGLFNSYWLSIRLGSAASEAVHDVPQVMGACLMLRPIERFDERFPLYCEDTDLCQRLRRHGRIVYVTDAVFTHRLGSSSEQNRWRSVALYNRGKELYFMLHQGRPAYLVALALNRLGALLRFAIWTAAAVISLGLVPKARGQSALFARVLFAPLLGPGLENSAKLR